MIHYDLKCGQDHAFDGWFKDSAAFERLAKRGLVECPECGDTKVQRALMRPAVAKREALPAEAKPRDPTLARDGISRRPPSSAEGVYPPARELLAMSCPTLEPTLRHALA